MADKTSLHQQGSWFVEKEGAVDVQLVLYNPLKTIGSTSKKLTR